MSEIAAITTPVIQPVTEDQGIRYDLTQWIFIKTCSYCAGRTLEIGEREMVGKYLGIANMPVELSPAPLELTVGQPGEVSQNKLYDTIIYLNETTPFTDLKEPVNACKDLIQPGGFLITILPAKTALYQWLAEGARRWRSHNKRNVSSQIEDAFRLYKLREFIISDDNHLTETINQLNERQLKIFTTAETAGYHLTGLCTLIVAQKR